MNFTRNHLRNYISMSFGRLFFIFFIVLFFISSIIVLITIAQVTFVVKMSFADLFWLYLYSLPNSVLFVLSITFFAAAILSLSKLSYDYEMLVLFALGVSPHKIVRVFLPLCALVSLTMLIFSLAIIPLSKSAYSNFVAEKRANIDVNIKSGEFGQKLGDWLVFVDSAKNRNYENLVLFSNKGLGFESFILAQNGSASSANGAFEMNLTNGVAYFAESAKIRKIDFENMVVRNAIDEVKLRSYDLMAYWGSAFSGDSRRNAERFTQYVLIALMPVASIFLLPLFGIANPRFSKNLSSLYILASVGIYYTLVYFAMEYAPLYGIVPLLAVWIGASYALYRRFILRFY
ncbi:LptF/LptG family permease [Helicobacter sp. 23-1044]